MPESEKLTGVGTDIFIRKIRPGATVGYGYMVDVYQNGVKQNTVKLRTKKDVLDLIKEFKDKYHTDRAFQNEIQVHVTYKTKEDRGETAMEHIDKELYKKAAAVENLLKTLIHPENPVKVRLAASAIEDGVVDFVPETAAPEGMQEEVLDDNTIAKNIAKKIIEYFNEVSPKGGVDPMVPGGEASSEWPEKDELYNTMKKWLTTVKKTVVNYSKTSETQVNYSKTSETQVNLGEVAKIVGSMVHSGNPQEIEAATGIPVSPEVAEKIKEITTMSVGNLSGPGGEKSPASLTAGALNPTASNKDKVKIAAEPLSDGRDPVDVAAKVIADANTQIGTMQDGAVIDMSLEQKEVISDEDKQKVQDAASQLPEGNTLAGETLQSQDYGDGLKKYDQEDKRWQAPGSELNALASEFWGYAGRDKYGYIEDVFTEWASEKNLELKTAATVWEDVSRQVHAMFYKKSELTPQMVEEAVTEMISALRQGKSYDDAFGIGVDIYMAKASVDDDVAQGFPENEAIERMSSIPNVMKTYLPEVLRARVKSQQITNDEYTNFVSLAKSTDWKELLRGMAAARSTKEYQQATQQLEENVPQPNVG